MQESLQKFAWSVEPEEGERKELVDCNDKAYIFS